MRKLLLSLMAVLLVSVTVMAQTRTISGRVTDSNGEPIPNASVVVKGTSIGTVTLEDGRYSLAIPNNARTLVVSAIGMAAQEATIGAGNTYNFRLSSESADLDEVIIVGYGSARKRTDVAGAFTKVDGEVVNNKPSANMLDAIQGRVAGLQVYTSSGEPSATPSVRLHGVGSISGGNTPLYVIDGIPVNSGSIVSLNPNDIESVTVLKDPSTTSIYGSRAANGVILYTTKKGKTHTSRLTVNSQYGISNLTKNTIDHFTSFMTTDELLAFWEETGIRTPAQVQSIRSQYGNNNTQWYKAYYKEDVPMYNLDMNLSGGGGKTTYFVSGSYFKQEGLAYRSAFERFTMRANVTSEVNDYIKFGLNLSGGVDDRETNPYGSNQLNRGLAMLTQPYFTYKDENGKDYPDAMPGVGRYHPRYLEAKMPSEGKNLQLNPSGYIEISPLKGLKLRSQAGMDFYDYTSYSLTYPSYLGSLNNGSRSESFERGYYSTITNTGEYSFNVKEDHSFSLLVGQEYTKSTTTSLSGSSSGQSDDRLVLISSGPNNRNASSSKSEYAFYSLFSKLNYNYNSKYYLDLSVRQDQSSRFGRDNRVANFWSVGAMWRMKKEAFLDNVNWLTELNLRVSHGTSGNSGSLGNYASLATVSNGIYESASSFQIGSAGNPLLSWESQAQTTVGFDAFLFNKINLTVDLYNRNTSDQLFSVPYPYTSGFSQIPFNTGSINNKGIDVELEYTVFKNQDWTITPFVNFNYNKNKVTELFQGRNYWVVPNTGVAYAVGMPISFLYPIWAGVNPQTGLAEWYLPDPDPEKFIYTTKDKNRTTTVFNPTALQQNTGIERYPPFTGGFGLNANYKGLYLSAAFSFASGKYLINNDRFFFENPFQFAGFNTAKTSADYWKQPGDNARFPRIGSGLFTQFDSRLIEDASFMRLKSLVVGYQVPKTILDKTKVIKGANISLTGRNLWTITKYSGPDPEVDSNLTLGVNPNSQQFVLGLSLQF